MPRNELRSLASYRMFPTLVLAGLALGIAIAEAQALRPNAACTGEAEASGRIIAVHPRGLLELDDGRRIRMADIETASGGQTAGGEDTSLLKEVAEGRRFALQRAAPDDRYGHAQVYLLGEEDGELLQLRLLAAGLARFSPRSASGACARSLLAAEQQARLARLGLWAESDLAPQPAEDPARVARQRGRFALVEGKVLSARESGGTIYLNFGRRWSEDFTATIAKRQERAFAASGIDPKSLGGKRVRIRGVVEERGGPLIEVVRPEQIEVLGP